MHFFLRSSFLVELRFLRPNQFSHLPYHKGQICVYLLVKLLALLREELFVYSKNLCGECIEDNGRVEECLGLDGDIRED